MMTRDELLLELRECQAAQIEDGETTHLKADRLLLEYINDPEIAEAFTKIRKWYS